MMQSVMKLLRSSFYFKDDHDQCSQDTAVTFVCRIWHFKPHEKMFDSFDFQICL